MNIDNFDKQDIDTQIELIKEFKIRRKLYLKRLRNKGIKTKNIPKHELNQIILVMDKIEDIKKEISNGKT